MMAIIYRELITMLRTRRAVALQVALVAALGLLVILRWPTDGHAAVDGSSSRQVLRVFGYGLMAMLIVIAPVFPATTIVREKTQGTLALLLNSPIHPASLAIGKLVGSLAYILAMLLLSMPAAAACFAMGGVDLLHQLVPIYLLLLLLAVQYATLGLLISSYAGNLDSALRLTYGAVLVMAVISLMPHQLLAGSMFLTPGMLSAIEWVQAVSPVPAMMQLLGDTGVASGGLASSGTQAARFLLLASISSVLFGAWTAARLSTRVLDKPRDSGTVTDERSLRVRVLRRIMYLWFFDPQRRTGMIAAWQNPVMVKEQRCRKFGRSNWVMRLIVATLILSILLVLAAATMSQTQGVATMAGIMVIVQFGLILLLTPSLAGGLISSERESRGWQLLQMTPMSAITIVTGKLLSVMVTLVLVLAATVPAYATLILIDPGQVQIAMKVLATLTLTALLALLVSAAVSSLFKHTATATAASYAVLLSLCAGTMLFWLGRDAPFNHRLVEWVLAVNPLASALNLTGVDGFDDYVFLPANWYFMAGMCGASLAVLIVRVKQLTRPS